MPTLTAATTDFTRQLAQIRQAMDFAKWTSMPPPPGAQAFTGVVDDELVMMTSGAIVSFNGRDFTFDVDDLVGWTFVVVKFGAGRYDGAATHGPTLTIVHLTEDLAKYAFEAANVCRCPAPRETSGEVCGRCGGSVVGR